jgi:hypothetical protein
MERNKQRNKERNKSFIPSLACADGWTHPIITKRFVNTHWERGIRGWGKRRNPFRIIACADFWTQSSQSKIWHITFFIIHSFIDSCTHSLTACPAVVLLRNKLYMQGALKTGWNRTRCVGEVAWDLRKRFLVTACRPSLRGGRLSFTGKVSGRAAGNNNHLYVTPAGS